MRPLALALLLLAPFALASHVPPIPTECRTEGLVEVTGGPGGPTFYLDTYQADEHGVKLYEETNGIWNEKPAGVYRDAETAGDLQRGGASPYVPDDPELEVCMADRLVLPDAKHL